MTPSTACAKSACGTRTATSSPSEIRRKVVPLAGEPCGRAADGHRHLPFHRHRGLDAAAQGAARRLPSALADHQRIIRAALAEHDGAEIDTQGDSFFAAFRRANAVDAAVGAQRAPSAASTAFARRNAAKKE